MSAENFSYPHQTAESQPEEEGIGPKLVSEFVGTGGLVFVVSVNVGESYLVGEIPPIAIGFLLAALVFMGGHVSGAHYNPSITLAILTRMSLPGSKPSTLSNRAAIYYILIQLLGGTVGALMAWGLTGFHPSPSPGDGYSIGQALSCEILSTFFLASVALNMGTTKSLEDNQFFGVAVGFVVAALAFTVGPISGAVMNPAIGTALIIVEGLNGGDMQYLWMYWLGPVLGASIAVVFFRLMNPREFNYRSEEHTRLLN